MDRKNHLRLVVNQEEVEPLPYGLVSLDCVICGRTVSLDLIKSGDAEITRIYGDSANGRGLMHYTCTGLAVLMEPSADDNDDADWE